MMASFLDDYEPVENRLRAFWNDHPQGRIETTLLGDAEGRYVVQALAFRDDASVRPSATGLAMERETERGVNATSALENCETSAIGRALANLGYAAKGKRPSREEMRKTANRPDPRPAGVDPETGEIVSAPRTGDASSAAPGGPPIAKPLGADTTSGSGTGAPAAPDSSRDKSNRPGSTSSPAGGRALGKAPAGEDTTSGEGTERSHAAPVSSTASTSPDDEAREGEELREEAGPAIPAQTPDVESPSRRPCLHLNGTKSVYSGSGPASTRIEVCVDCGVPLEEVRR